MLAYDEKTVDVPGPVKIRLEELIKAIEAAPDAQTLLFQTVQ